MEISEKADKLICEIVETAYPWVQSTAENDAVLEKVVNRLEHYIATLEAENAQLKEAARWIPVSEMLPELDQDVEVLDVDTKHIIVGHFFDYNEGEPDSEIMFDEHGIGEYYSLDILPKKCHWRYAALPEVK